MSTLETNETMALSNTDWVVSIKTKLDEEVMPSNNIKRCIYRVPGWLKEHVCDGNDQTPYVPEIISFGPYHRGKSELAEMEKHKWRCLKKMLEREEQQVDEYLQEMKELEAEVRACYQEPGVITDSNDFVEMLVLDGCFMLEFLRVQKFGFLHLKYSPNDPVFSKSTITHVIARDMIKLENQIPIIVLKRLLEIQYETPISDSHIPRLVLRSLSSIWVTNEIPNKKKLKEMRKAVASDSENEMLHCLDIFRSGLLYQPTSNSKMDVTMAQRVKNICSSVFLLLSKMIKISEEEEQVVGNISRRRTLPNSIRRLSRVNNTIVLEEEELQDLETGGPPAVDDVSSRIASSGSRPIQNRPRTLRSWFAESDNSEINVPNLRLDEPQEQQLGQAVESEGIDNHVPNLRSDEFEVQHIDSDGEVVSSEIGNAADSRPNEFEVQHIDSEGEAESSEIYSAADSRPDEFEVQHINPVVESGSSENRISNSRQDESEEQTVISPAVEQESPENNVSNLRLDEPEEQHIDAGDELRRPGNHVSSVRLDEPEEQLIGLGETESRNPENQVSNLRLDEPEENLISPNTCSESSEERVSVSSSEHEHGEQNYESRNMSLIDRVIMTCGWRPRQDYKKIVNNSALMVYCVEDLREAGVKFKSRNCQSFWDLKFDKKNGLLEIPPIKIDDATKTVFLNLIAYEQCHLRDFTDMHITDYVAFMDNLVNSAADVGHLHQAGIVVHQLGSDVEVADLFNRFVKKAFVHWKDGRLSKLYEELNKYCTHKRHRWSASWRNEYMKNPWVIISIIAAFLLFGATLLQTIFTVFPYYIPGKS